MTTNTTCAQYLGWDSGHRDTKRRMNFNRGNGRGNLCYFFQQGDCRYGNRCWNVHSMENQNVSSQAMAKSNKENVSSQVMGTSNKENVSSQMMAMSIKENVSSQVMAKSEKENVSSKGIGKSNKENVSSKKMAKSNKEPLVIRPSTKYYKKHHEHFSNHMFNMMNRIEEEVEIRKKYMIFDRFKYMQEMIRIGSMKEIRTQFVSAGDMYEYDVDYSTNQDDKILCSNKWIKPKTCKPWTSKDLPKIVIIELLEESKSYCMQPSKLKHILKQSEIFKSLKENPRFNLEKNLIALKIDDVKKIPKMLELKFLINENDAERYRAKAKGQVPSLLRDYWSDDEFFVDHVVFPVRCFQLVQNSSECERWWEDVNKHVVIHIIPSGDREAYEKKIEIKFQNDQEVEDTELLSIAEWSRHLKPNYTYFCGLCNTCAAEPSKLEDSSRKKLLICAGCQLVSYCSKDCQKEDWNQHKTICKDIGVNKTFLGTKFPPGMNVFECGHDLIKSMNQKAAKKFFLSYLRFRGRPLDFIGANKYGSIAIDQYVNGNYNEPTDKIRHNELKFPKICYACYEGKREELTICDCRCVAFCSKDHKKDKNVEVVKDHEKICKTMYRIARVYSYCRNNLPSELPIPQTQAEVAKLIGVFEDPAQYPVPAEYRDDPWLDVKQALVSEHLSVPLTILYVMKEITCWTNTRDFIGNDGTKGKSSLTIHLLCAQPLLDPVSWELFLHECKGVKQLNLVFCNNGVSYEYGRDYNPSADINDCVNHLNISKKLKRCDSCQEDDRLITYHVFNGSYSSYFSQVASIKPDIVFASGTLNLSENAVDSDDEDDEESYNGTPYSSLLTIKRCPLILAEESSERMTKAVDKLSRSYRCQELMRVKKNPFAGFSRERKVIDKICGQSPIRNEKNWITCIRRKN